MNLRFFRTVRPLRVRIRRIKPCTLFRRRFFGWYVRFGNGLQSSQPGNYNYLEFECQFATTPMNSKKSRLDVLLLSRDLAETRQKAQALIMAGQVLVNGQRASKPGAIFPGDSEITLKAAPLYVGRGGLKLAHGLDAFALDPTDITALDVGASTGGFTDCLLQRGACRVYALDVGRGQLHHRLRTDPRVAVMEGVNAHHAFTLPEAVSLAVVDVAFISITQVIPNILPHLTPGGSLLALVKPQFEARRDEVGRKGIVKDPAVHARVLGRVSAWAVGAGLRIRGLTASPILGAEGNREFFILFHKHEPAPSA